ncbi:S1 family peptidase [bacterium]|nr:S1 family peptidase [bacterium]
MYKIFLVLFLILSVSVFVKADDTEIINGMTGDMNGTGPFMVYLSTYKKVASENGSFVIERSGCSGVLIKKNIVLTAAHCFLIGGYDQVDVHFTLRYSEVANYPVRHASRIINHADYNKSKDVYKNDGYMENDIALVRFEGDLPKGYKPVNYKISDDSIYLGQSVLVAGYGLVYDTADPRMHYHYLDNLGKLYSTRLIFDKEFPKDELYATNITADQADKTGMCRGDSGGAALVRDAKKNFLLVGINSMTGDDKTCFGKAYFARVALYQTWIEDNLKLLAD